MASFSLVDVHAHLEDERFHSDLEETLRRAREAGVAQVITAGIDLTSSRAALTIAEAFEGVFVAVGFHPHEAVHLDEASLRELGGLCGHPQVVAVGEIGLDFYRQHSPPEAQLRALELQLDLARQYSFPVVIHCRDAWDQLLPILRRWVGAGVLRSGSPGVLHCFSGDLSVAQKAMELGFALSIAGPVTYPRANGLGEVVAALPLERLVVETDAPYLAPQVMRGRRNEPAYLWATLRKVAEIKGTPAEVVAMTTSRNARDLFGLPS